MLYDHQQKIIDDDPSYAGLWLGTGSGKTRTALALAEGRVLVICPKTQRDDQNWERELEKMGIEKNITVLSKEDFRRDWEKLDAFDTIICDEADTLLGITPNVHYKNKQPRPKASQLFWSIYFFTKKHKPKRLYLLTATIVKTPMTAFGAGVLLGKCSISQFYQFRDIYYVKLPMAGREVYAPKKDAEVKERLGKFVQSMGYTGQLSDYFDVPTQTYLTEHVELTGEQKELIKESYLDYPDPIVNIGKRNQIENGVYEEKPVKDNKVPRIIELSEEFPKMIVFCKYTLQIEKLKKALEKEGKKVYTMTGKTKNRGELLKEINECDNYVFIVQAQISAGWELPDCPVMVFASRTYSVVDYIQGRGRILRASSLKKNLYINLICKYKGSIDEAINNCLINKEDFDEKVYAKIK